MGDRILSVFVQGTPIPQGQMMPRMVCRLRGNKQCKAWLCPPDKQAWKDWRSTIEIAAREALDKNHRPEKGFVYMMTLYFGLQRPKSHYTAKGNFTKSAPRFHTVRPDVDNLTKAVNDSLTRAGVWHDDSELVSCHIEKAYVSSSPGVMINVTRLRREDD